MAVPINLQDRLAPPHSGTTHLVEVSPDRRSLIGKAQHKRLIIVLVALSQTNSEFRRGREKTQLREMAGWPIERLLLAVSPTQRQYLATVNALSG